MSPSRGAPAAGSGGAMAAPAPPPAQATTPASPATTPMPPGAGQVVQGQLSAPGATPGAMSAASKRIAKGMLATTPGKMSWLRALSIAISFVYALAGAGTLYANSSALTRASTNTSQVVLVQGIYADLLRADADATNAFLVSGLERPEQRADYEAALARVSSNIAAAATAQPADADALATLNVAVQGYASAVESARAYNRQGMPVGAQYLKQASTSLRATALPLLDNLRVANVDRAEAEFSGARSLVPFLVVGLLTLGVLGAVAVWLAKVTHRYINVGLTAAIGAVLVSFIAGFAMLTSTANTVESTRTTQFAQAVALTNIRSAAFDIRANESLGLIARGQAAPYETQVQKRITEVTSILKEGRVPNQTAVTKAWDQYLAAHANVRRDDDAFRWDQAVVTATAVDGGSYVAFKALDEATATPLTTAQADLSTRILSPRTPLFIAAIVALLAGVAASGLAARGIAQRLEEYR